jgi:NAD(P)-dependent dehydrogenase (short-subunit alcohol dehydrogenase family)
MKIDLSGSNAVVTGGAEGIGYAVAEALAACGANVGLLDRNEALLHEAVAALTARDGGRAIGVVADVSDAEQLRTGIARVAEEWAGLHLAVNNAGVAGAPGLLHEMGLANWRAVLGVNLDGVGVAMMAEIEHMLRAGGGSIVNIASVEAHAVLKGFPSYTTSKHAVRGLTKAVALDYAPHGIRVNSVSPGVIRTPLTMAPGQVEVTERLAEKIPLGRLGVASEIAATVAFLLSDLSSYTTGSDFLVDGGFLLRE